MRKRVLFTVMGALIASALCTGCGSSDNEKTPTGVVYETNPLRLLTFQYR